MEGVMGMNIIRNNVDMTEGTAGKFQDFLGLEFILELFSYYFVTIELWAAIKIIMRRYSFPFEPSLVQA